MFKMEEEWIKQARKQLIEAYADLGKNLDKIDKGLAKSKKQWLAYIDEVSEKVELAKQAEVERQEQESNYWKDTCGKIK